jgi:hypothetical protein
MKYYGDAEITGAIKGSILKVTSGSFENVSTVNIDLSKINSGKIVVVKTFDE